MRSPQPLAAMAVLLAVLIVAGCGGPAGIQDVALVDLADRQETYSGQTVRAQGVLRTYPDPKHYWIEDADLNRVELVPHDRLEALVGLPVRVVGRFTFRETEGRRITVEQLELLD